MIRNFVLALLVLAASVLPIPASNTVADSPTQDAFICRYLPTLPFCSGW